MNYRKINSTHAEARLYGNIGTWFTNGNSFTTFIEDLESSGFKELTLRLHCYGGVVFEGNVMKNAMQRTSLKLNIIIDGVAASMGCMILTGIPNENVSIAENAFGMVHRPSGGDDGDADDHLATAKLLQDMETNFAKVIAERSGLTEEEVRAKWFNGKDHWLNADEMVKYGFASKKVAAIASRKVLDKEMIESLTMESIYDRYAAVLNINNKITVKMDVALLIATFGLEGVTAESEPAAVLAALQAKFNKQNERITTLENEAKERVTAQIKAMLDEADAAGKIVAVTGQTKDEARAVLTQIGEKSGIEALRGVLKAMAPKKSIMSQIPSASATSAPTGGTVAKTWNWYQENDPEALERMEKEDNESFRALHFNEYGVYPE